MGKARKRKCSMCKLSMLDGAMFYKDRRSSDGLTSMCKKCSKIYARQFKRVRPLTEKRRVYYKNHHYKKKYGITLDEYFVLAEEQGNVCKTCKGNVEGRPLYVDHDHLTGEVRGLLCQRCNTALGMVHDSKETLRNMIDYLGNCKPLNADGAGLDEPQKGAPK